MSNPLVSVIIPVYNVVDYLKECCDSVFNQTYDNIEIVLVDDGSTDGSSELCDMLGKADSRTIIIHRENGGLSVARNTGLDVCSGDFITFVDSDDVIATNMVERLVFIQQKEQADVVQCGNIRWTRECEIFEANGISNHSTVAVYSGSDFIVSGYYEDMSCSKLYRGCVLQNYRFREGIIHEDYALTYRIMYDSKRVAFLDEPLYFARVREGSITQLGFRRESLILVKLSEERVEFFTRMQNAELLDYAYTGYYGYLLSFYNNIKHNQSWNVLEKKLACDELLKKYRKNINKFLKIKKVGFGTKIRLIACFLIPELWNV